MNNKTMLAQRVCLAVAAALTLIVVESCGGGVVGSGGTGRQETGQSVGTVNGFGSVIVDGILYDVFDANVLSEIAPATDVVAEVKLGERVSVSYETAGVARQVRVETTVSGPVAAISAAGLSVLGQTIAVNTGTGSGPRTEFAGGYAQTADIRVGDSVDVHGVLVQGAPVYSIQATRIEKTPQLPAFLRVTGLVSNLSRTGAATFALAGLVVDAADAVVVPSGSVLTEGQAVTLLAPLATLTTSNVGRPAVRAAQVRILRLENGGLEDVVSGSVANVDTVTHTFFLGSLKVRYAAAVMAPLGAALANQQYVRVQGAIDFDGSLVATRIDLREGETGNESTLRGNIGGYDAAANRLTVRDVVVDIAGATLEECPAVGLSNGLFAEIEGVLSGSGVVARTIHCESETSGSTVEREGTASMVDIVSRRFALTPERGPAILVEWSDRTFFGNVSPATLNGKKVEVEGALESGVLQATKVKAED